jgi:hypothetical protein
MDWVEKRAYEEDLLRRDAPRKWGYLQTAIEHAASSYQNHYGTSLGVTVTCGRMYNNCLQISWIPRQGQGQQARTMKVEFDQGSMMITATPTPKDTAAVTLKIGLNAEGSVALLDKGSPVTEEQASQATLEGFLFR